MDGLESGGVGPQDGLRDKLEATTAELKEIVAELERIWEAGEPRRGARSPADDGASNRAEAEAAVRASLQARLARVTADRNELAVRLSTLLRESLEEDPEGTAN